MYDCIESFKRLVQSSSHICFLMSATSAAKHGQDTDKDVDSTNDYPASGPFFPCHAAQGHGGEYGGLIGSKRFGRAQLCWRVGCLSGAHM
jgi:hypothetical protein